MGGLTNENTALVYKGYAGIHSLINLFQFRLPELELKFNLQDFVSFYDRFKEREVGSGHSSVSEIDPEFYYIDGRSCRIHICLEAHESYYLWTCFATRKDCIEPLRAYLEKTLGSK